MDQIRRHSRIAVATLTVLGLALIVLALAWGHQTPIPAEGRSDGAQARPTASGRPSITPTPSSPNSPSSGPADDATGEGRETATLPRSAPLQVEIPAIDVRSSLLELGLAQDGTAEVPSSEDADQAGWYRYSPTPGELGPAVIIGHVDSETGPAVFYRLQDLTPGDDIRVEREDGTVAEFTVDNIDTFAKDSFPTEQVYGDIDHSGLRLITCGGTYDGGSGGYQANTVVFATLAQP